MTLQSAGAGAGAAGAGIPKVPKDKKERKEKDHGAREELWEKSVKDSKKCEFGTHDHLDDQAFQSWASLVPFSQSDLVLESGPGYEPAHGVALEAPSAAPEFGVRGTVVGPALGALGETPSIVALDKALAAAKIRQD